MNCLTIRTPDIGHNCKYELKINHSHLLQVRSRQIRQISSICLLKIIKKPQLHPQGADPINSSGNATEVFLSEYLNSSVC